jgi:hypothetical protein
VLFAQLHFIVFFPRRSARRFLFVLSKRIIWARLHLRFSFCRDKSSRRAREEETFSTGQKVITLPQGWHGFFFISFSFLLTIFVYGKKITSIGSASHLRRVDFFWCWDHRSSPRMDWAGLNLWALTNRQPDFQHSDYNSSYRNMFHRSRFSSPGRAPD